MGGRVPPAPRAAGVPSLPAVGTGLRPPLRPLAQPSRGLPPELLQRFAAEASRGGMDVDRLAYAAADRDPSWPILLGSGSLDAWLGVFGRDPGRTEVELAEPFVGRGGQLIRAGLHRAWRGTEPQAEQALEVGRRVFWANTVPYKPTGNKAWSTAVKRRFEPLVREALGHWRGPELLVCGREAFFWFALGDRSLQPSLEAFWAREDRYQASLEVPVGSRTVRLHPLPHPSPLNARWFGRFPALLDARLASLGWSG